MAVTDYRAVFVEMEDKGDAGNANMRASYEESMRNLATILNLSEREYALAGESGRCVFSVPTKNVAAFVGFINSATIYVAE